jgi:hypothetical protein
LENAAKIQTYPDYWRLILGVPTRLVERRYKIAISRLGASPMHKSRNLKEMGPQKRRMFKDFVRPASDILDLHAKEDCRALPYCLPKSVGASFSHHQLLALGLATRC